MAEQVFRYVVPVDGQSHTVELKPGHSAGPYPLHVEARAGMVEFWAIHADDGPALSRTFQVFGTGHPLPPCALWVGTAPRTPEGLVWHLFELIPEELVAAREGR